MSDEQFWDLSSASIPQADRVERVLEYALLTRYRELALRDLLFSGRDALYYRSAAQVLGLLDDWGQPTELIAQLRSGEYEPLKLLRACFEASEVGRAWARWAHCTVWRVDADSAEAFLGETTQLAESTRTRRAKTLRTWLDSLRPELIEEVDSVEVLRGKLLRRPVYHLDLSIRCLNVFRRERLDRIADVAALGRSGLRKLYALGSTSIRELDLALMQEPPGESLDELHRAMREHAVVWDVSGLSPPTLGPAPSTPEFPPVEIDTSAWTWDTLASVLPEHLLSWKIEQLNLPTRMLGYCKAGAFESLGELVQSSEGSLRAVPGIGTKTIQDALQAIAQAAQAHPIPEPVVPEFLAPEPTIVERLGFDPESTASALALWQAILGTLPEREQLILRRRSGTSGPAVTLAELGQQFGFSRERARQIESHALDSVRAAPGWLELVDRRLTALRGDVGFLWLSQLEDDPWLAPLAERVELVRYLTHHLLEPTWVLYVVDEGDCVLTRKRELALGDMLRELRRTLQTTDWPKSMTEFDALVSTRLVPADAADLHGLMLELLRGELILDDEEQPTRVLGFGGSRDAKIRASIAASSEPVAVADLQRRFGRGRLPSDCIFVRRGFVTLPMHMRGFERWQERLVPEVERLMQEEGPQLQWMSADLLAALAQRSKLPDWLTPMLLASMLRHSGSFDDLGRQRFALAGSSGGERLQLVPALVAILESAGGPMDEAVLFDELRTRTTVLETTAAGLRSTLPLVPLGDGRIGLLERDVPGGREAAHEAAELIETELRRRSRGLTYFQALQMLRGIAPIYAEWNETMLAAAPKVSNTLMSTRFGVGLDSWGNCRVRTSADLLRDLLDEGEGGTTVTRLQEEFRKHYGRDAPRTTVAGTAYAMGARLRGDRISSREIDEPPVMATATTMLPSVEDLRLPYNSRRLFTKLVHEDVGDWDTLLARCGRHVGEFEAQRAHNGFLPLGDARAILRTLHELVARVRDGADPIASRLVWALGRYFEIPDDGEMDFAIGGLDDDIEVFNAITQHLGFDELEVKFS